MTGQRRRIEVPFLAHRMDETAEDEEAPVNPLDDFSSRPNPERVNSARVFAAKKAHLLNRIVPLTMVPMSTANGMLVVGSNMSDLNPKTDCFFPLREFLLVAGSCSLSLILMAIVSKYLLEWVLQDQRLSRTGHCVLVSVRKVGVCLTFFQILLMVGGTVVILPNLSKISFDVESKYYCQEGPVVFSTVFLTMNWVFLLFAAVAYVYIHCVEGEEQMVKPRTLDNDRSGLKGFVLNGPSFHDAEKELIHFDEPYDENLIADED